MSFLVVFQCPIKWTFVHFEIWNKYLLLSELAGLYGYISNHFLTKCLFITRGYTKLLTV